MVGVKSVSIEVLVIREVMERLDCTSIIGHELLCLMRGTLVEQASIPLHET